MTTLASDAAITRFKENETRLDTFLNTNNSYTTNETTPRTVQSIPKLMADLIATYSGYRYTGAWQTSTAYVFLDQVLESGIVYLCLSSHTSGTFATDLAASKWAIYQVSDAEYLTYTFDGTGTIQRSIQDILSETRSITRYTLDVVGDTDITTPFQNAIDDLPAYGGTIEFPEGLFKFTGVTCTKPGVTIVGKGSGVTIFENSGAGEMITFSQATVADQKRRNPTRILDIGFEDSDAATGTGIYFNNCLFVEVTNCNFFGFDTGRSVYYKDVIWGSFNRSNTDRSELRFEATTTPHYNNALSINGPCELRNPKSYGIYVETCDILSIRDVTIEGDSGGLDTATAGMYLENVACITGDHIYAEYLRGSEAVIKMENCRSFSFSTCFLGSQSYTVPGLLMNDCAQGDFNNCHFNWQPFDISDSCFDITFDSCRFAGGALKYEPNSGVKFLSCGPASISGAAQSCVIPVDPIYLESQCNTPGIPLKNWYTDSSFKTRNPITAGDIAPASTCTTTYDQTQGYMDDCCLKCDFVAGQSLVFLNMGTTDDLNSGAIISFMAKSDVPMDFAITGSISSTVGSANFQITTQWRRYFMFTLLSSTPAGTGINMILLAATNGQVLIDDIQTVSYANYLECFHKFENFRHIPTYGTKITVPETRNRENFRKDFDRGLTLRVRSYTPAVPVVGEFNWCDGTTWNPAGMGSTPVVYRGTAWYGVPLWLGASKTWNPASIANAGKETTTVTVTGAALGDFAMASLGVDLQELDIKAYVSAADTVTVILRNNTGGAIDLGSSTLRVRVQKA